jgi:hypothetical protein
MPLNLFPQSLHTYPLTGNFPSRLKSNGSPTLHILLPHGLSGGFRNHIALILLLILMQLISFHPELRLGIAGNRRFSGSCDVIATVRGLFHSLRSLKQTKSLSQNSKFAFLSPVLSVINPLIMKAILNNPVN